ncbi:glycoprotein endo-alpha-1,2-mannosidase-like [Tubulanus polymorphus]|uniref:glycoprotein endo-alpha-1,2-mannosidase-like n=1 Tax=Tubulanus polymorphus TaxID=672921 RepID=UPI003DA3C4F7
MKTQWKRTLIRPLKLRSLRKYYYFVVLLLIALICFIAFTIQTHDIAEVHTNFNKLNIITKKRNDIKRQDLHPVDDGNAKLKESLKASSIEFEKYKVLLDKKKSTNLNYNVHVFYYPWYGNPLHDGKYKHWNHEYIKHWDKDVAKKWPNRTHAPPHDIGASFYPALGAYSSRDPTIIDLHMKQLLYAGIGVIVVTWYPSEVAASNEDWLIGLFNIANSYDIKVTFHLEPYEGRSITTVRKDLVYIKRKYGSHPAFYTRTFRKRKLPVFYVYDSYLIGEAHWSQLLKPHKMSSIRGSGLDAFFVGLVVGEFDVAKISRSGFDAFYSYFASDGFTFGSSMNNWKLLKYRAAEKNMYFIPSVGPGYDDEQVRPWNSANTRRRTRGTYYRNHFEAALEINPIIITITSFNEWHEGTQIEMAVPKKNVNFEYRNYLPNDPQFYLDLTATFVQKFKPPERNNHLNITG